MYCFMKQNIHLTGHLIQFDVTQQDGTFDTEQIWHNTNSFGHFLIKLKEFNFKKFSKT